MSSKCTREYSVFVGGLANNVTNTDLFNYFSIFGNIKSCDVQMWKNNPIKCRGFAIVTAADLKTYELIINAQHKLGGRNIECKEHIKDRSQLNDYSKNEVNKKVFVSGLSKKVTDEDFKAYFSQFGAVKIAYVVKHHKDQKSKGFGFVIFDSKSDRIRALQLDGHMICGKKVCCNEYSTKANLKKKDIISQEVSYHESSEDDTNYQSTTGNSDSESNGRPAGGIESQYQARFNAFNSNGLSEQPNTDIYGVYGLQNRYDAHCANHLLYEFQTTPRVTNRPIARQIYSPFQGSNLLGAKLAMLYRR